MLFPTAVFAIFFFLVFHVHWLLARAPRTRKAFLLCASLFFYGYWSWKFALMLLGSAVLNHLAAVRIAAWDRGGDRGHSRRLIIVTLLFNLGMLFVFKYTGFVVGDMLFPALRPIFLRMGPEAVAQLVALQDAVYPWLSRIVLPVGISFFTFQALSYVIDVYRRHTKPAASWLDFANYLAFFPQLVAGPIVRAADLVPQMESMPGRGLRLDAGRAVFLILVGFFKKTVVANWLATRLADPVFAWPAAYSGPDIVLGVYGYAVQIYCDFSAYSDIAIGTALLMGFHFPDNFNAPYFATSLQDFWRRWHISLSTWLRDYLYIPLGGSRKGALRTYANLFITFLLGGLWHGAAWTFVLWGAFHGAYLTLERKVNEWIGRRPPAATARGEALRALSARVWIFHVVCFSWLLFRGGDVETVRELLAGIGAWRGTVDAVTLWTPPALVMVAVGFATQWCDGNRMWRMTRRLSAWPAWLLGAAAAIVLTLIQALGPEGVAPFIYFQF